MKSIIIACILLFFGTGLSQPVQERTEEGTMKILSDIDNLMPVPYSIIRTDGEFRLDSSFTIAVRSGGGTRIYPETSRMLQRLKNRTGYFLKQDFLTPDKTGPDNASMTVITKREGELKLGEEESYSLVITPKGIDLTAETDLGALHGLETILQLLNIDEKGYYFPAVEINDKPRFPWRGLMIDVSRHWLPVDVIKRNLDAMAAMKLNVFHWHLSEDQGFRVESKVYPKLHEMGSDGFYFTQAQIKDIIEYADQRGIRVIPEFDVPGHATAWFVGYPELASQPGPYSVERNWGIQKPVMDPTKEFTYEFLGNFFTEMAALFPDEYFHIGGDEVLSDHWDANEDIQEYMDKNDIEDNHELQAYFNNRVLEILTGLNKKMIGWDEIYHPDMPTNIVIHSWRGRKSLYEAAKDGYQGILSNGYYIDLIQPAEFHYLNDPCPSDAPLTAEQRALILGGEVTSWGEIITYETVDSRIWPRTAPIAERFWSPEEIRDVESMYRRMEWMSFLLEEHGLLHKKNYELMLRRLAWNKDITDLKRFVDMVEPVKIYTRHRQGVKYTQQSPYTRVVDAARPESHKSRKFRNAVDLWLETQDENLELVIKEHLEDWSSIHNDVLPLLEFSPILHEMIPISENLMKTCFTALDAMTYIENNDTADELWLKSKLEQLEEAEKPYGQVELMIVSAVKKMVKAAAGLDWNEEEESD